jgi:hypothetical protein
MEVKTWDDLVEVTESIYTALREARGLLALFVEDDDPPWEDDDEVKDLLGRIRSLSDRIPYIYVGCRGAPLQDLTEEVLDIREGAYHVLDSVPVESMWWYSDLERALADVDELLVRTMDVRDEIARHLRETQARSCAG